MRAHVRAIAALGLAAAPAFLFSSDARATCGSATCFLVTGTQQGLAPEGALVADLSIRYVDQDRMLEGSSDTDTVLVPKVDFEHDVLVPDHHRELRTRLTTLQLDIGYALGARLSLLGSVPLLVDKDHEHFDDAGTPDEHFVGTDGTRGLGDLALGARYGLLVRSSDILMGDLSLELPTGAYKLRDSEGDINEPTIQPGSGSYDLTAGLHYSHHFSPQSWELFLAGTYRRNGENDLRYRIGDESVLTAGIDHGGEGRWEWSVQVNARLASRDAFHGDDVPSTGSTFIDLTPGAAFKTTSGSRLYGYVQVPVHQHVNEAQLAPSLSLVVGVTKTF